MDRFLIALFKSFFVGVVNSDNAAEAAARATAAVNEAVGVVKSVDAALFHAGLFAWSWDTSRSSDEWLNLTVFGEIGVVAEALGSFIDGWDGELDECCNWHSKFGLIIRRDVPMIEWDGVVEPDWEAMGVE